MFLDAFLGFFTVGFGVSRNKRKIKKFWMNSNPYVKVFTHFFVGMALGIGCFISVFATFQTYSNPSFITQLMEVPSQEALQPDMPEDVMDVIERKRREYNYYNTDEKMALGTRSDVTVAEDLVFGPWDTEKGSITAIDTNIDTSIILPLCYLNVDIADNWWVTYKVVGGYEPINGTVWYFSQKGEIVDNELRPGMWVGYYVTWYYLGHSTTNCCTEYWQLTFDTDCNNWGCLDSNQYPDGAEHNSSFSTIPGKEVWLNVSTLWSGCSDPDQQFTLISLQELISPYPQNTFK